MCIRDRYWINNQSQYCRNIVSFFSKYSLKRYIRNNHSGKQHTDRTNHIVHHIQDILYTRRQLEDVYKRQPGKKALRRPARPQPRRPCRGSVDPPPRVQIRWPELAVARRDSRPHKANNLARHYLRKNKRRNKNGLRGCKRSRRRGMRTWPTRTRSWHSNRSTRLRVDETSCLR